MAKNLQCFLHQSKEAGKYLLDGRCYDAFNKDLLLKHNLILIEKYSYLEVSRRKLVVSKKPTKEIYVEGRILCFLDRTTSEKFLAFISKASTLSPVQKWRANVEFSIRAQEIKNVADTNPAFLQKGNVFQLVYQEGATYDGNQVGIEYLCAPNRYVKRKCIKKITSFCIESVDMALPDKYHPGVWRAEALVPYYDCCNKINKTITGCTDSNVGEYDQTEKEDSEEMRPYLIYEEDYSDATCLYESGYVALAGSSPRQTVAATYSNVPGDSGYTCIEDEEISSKVDEYEEIRPPPPPLRLPVIPPRASNLAQEVSKMHEECRGNSPMTAAPLVSAVYENTTEERKVNCEGDRNSEQRSGRIDETTKIALTAESKSYEIIGQTSHSPAIIVSTSFVAFEHNETCKMSEQEKSVEDQKVSVNSSAITNCSTTMSNNSLPEKRLRDIDIIRDMTKVKQPYSGTNSAIAFAHPIEEHDKNLLANCKQLDTNVGQKKLDDKQLTENINHLNDKKSLNNNDTKNIELLLTRDNYEGNKILGNDRNITDKKESNHSNVINLHSDVLSSLNLTEDPDRNFKGLQEQQRYNSSSNNAMMPEHKSGIIDKKTTSKIPSNHEPNTKDIEVQTSLSLAAGIVLKDKSPDNADHKDKSSDNTDHRDKSPLNTDHPCAHSVYQDRSKMDGCNFSRIDHGYFDRVSHQYGRNAMPYCPPMEYYPHDVAVGSPMEYYPHGQMPDGLYHPQPYSRPPSMYYPPPGPSNLQRRPSLYHPPPGSQILQQRRESGYYQSTYPPEPEQRAQRCMQCCTNSSCQPTASRHCQ